MSKTTQALKISASWTPNKGPAEKMIAAALGKGPAAQVHVAGGRLAIKHAIKIDFSDPAQAGRVADRISAIKAELEAVGTVHTFTTVAGAVPVAEAEVLPELAAEAE